MNADEKAVVDSKLEFEKLLEVSKSRNKGKATDDGEMLGGGALLGTRQRDESSEGNETVERGKGKRPSRNMNR